MSSGHALCRIEEVFNYLRAHIQVQNRIEEAHRGKRSLRSTRVLSSTCAPTRVGGSTWSVSVSPSTCSQGEHRCAGPKAH